MLEFYMQMCTIVVTVAIGIILIICLIGLVGFFSHLFNEGKDIIIEWYKKYKLKGELKNVTKKNDKSRK